jgi:ParB-like nuclease domain
MTTEEVRKVDQAGDRAGDVELVPLSAIKVDEKKNVRSHYDGIEEFAKQIDAQGLLTPLTVDQNYNLWAGFRRMRALQLLNKNKPDTLVKVTKKLVEAPSEGFLLNLGENSREAVHDYDLSKRLHEMEEKFGIKRAHIEKMANMSKTAVGKFITTWQSICAKVRKAWEASAHNELKDTKTGKLVQIPTVRIYEWSKKEPKVQEKLLEAFLDDDRQDMAPSDDGGGEESSSEGEGDEPSRTPKKKEIKEFVEKLVAKETKDGKLAAEDVGRLKALRWVLGDIGRRTMMEQG